MRNQDKPFVWTMTGGGILRTYHDRTKDEMVSVIHSHYKKIGYIEHEGSLGFHPCDTPMKGRTYKIVHCRKNYIIVHSQDGGLIVNGRERPSTRFISMYKRRRTE